VTTERIRGSSDRSTPVPGNPHGALFAHTGRGRIQPGIERGDGALERSRRSVLAPSAGAPLDRDEVAI
jgi:hypothetical protein